MLPMLLTMNNNSSLLSLLYLKFLYLMVLLNLQSLEEFYSQAMNTLIEW